MRALGILGVLFFAAHATVRVAQGHPEDLLWICHLASFAIGIGLLLRWPQANATGALWLAVGLPAWSLDVAMGGEFETTSLLTHWGGAALGILGARRLGTPQGSWWKALLIFAALQEVCHWTTPVASNVNLAHAVWPGWERMFTSFGIYRATCLAASAAIFFIAEKGLKRLDRRKRDGCATS